MFYPVRRPKTHMVLCVRADGRDWLCDLGLAAMASARHGAGRAG